MTSRHTPLLVVALGALALGACECIKTVPQCPDGVKCITYDQYCDQSFQARWAMLQKCGLVDPGAAYPLSLPQRDAVCSPTLDAKVDAGLVVFKGVGAYECLQNQRTTCDSRCRWEGAPLLPQLGRNVAECTAPCNHVFEGTRTFGETCELSTECLDGLYCDLEHGCPGRCATQLRVGEPTPRVEACRTGFTLFLVDGGLRCDDLVDAGLPCGRADDEFGFHRCAAGYACLEQPLDAGDGGDGDGGFDDGGADAGDAGSSDAGPPSLVCVSWPDAGAVPAIDCERSGCPFGQYCSGHRCVAVARRGQSCVAGLIFCAEGLNCSPDAGSSFCEPAPPAGSACVSGTSCDAKAICVGNVTGAVCVAIAADGGSCGDVEGCAWPLRCLHLLDAGVCGPGLAAGSACDEALFECAAGTSCVDGGCVAASCPPSR